MLNPFPGLLLYSFFAPTLLRVAVALILVWVAYRQWRSRAELARARFFGLGGPWAVWLIVAVELVAAAGLFFGYYTQWAAILGALIALKFAVWDHRYPHFFPLSRIGALLLLVVCLSLLLSGAGGFAYDLPL